MKKINALLHEVTFIDFAYLWTLVKRYKKFFVFFPVFVIIATVYFYSRQNTIYQLNADLKIEQKTSLANLGAFSGSMGEAFELFTSEEVINLNASYDFNSRLAETILSHKEFDQMNFSPIAADNGKINKELFANCQTKSCEIDRLASVLPQFYKFQDSSINQRYSIKVTTTDPLSTRIILNSVIATLDSLRMETLRSTVDRQISAADELLKKSQDEIKKKGGFHALEQEGYLNSTITETQEKIRSMMMLINSEKSSLTSLELKHIENKSTLMASKEQASSSAKQDKLKHDQYQKLRSRQIELRQNLAQLTSIGVDFRSKTDDKIITQIQNELEKIETDIRALRINERKVAYDDSFINQQQSNESNLEFDYNIQGNKVRKLSKEYDGLRKHMEELIDKKVKLETEMLAIRPDLEYVKMLESKLMNLKLVKTTITSDVIFEKVNPNIASFKRSSISKIFMFSFLFGFFIFFVLLISRYMFDDRIYSEKEIEKMFDNMKVIGHTPDFR